MVQELNSALDERHVGPSALDRDRRLARARVGRVRRDGLAQVGPGLPEVAEKLAWAPMDVEQEDPECDREEGEKDRTAAVHGWWMGGRMPVTRPRDVVREAGRPIGCDAQANRWWHSLSDAAAIGTKRPRARRARSL